MNLFTVKYTNEVEVYRTYNFLMLTSKTHIFIISHKEDRCLLIDQNGDYWTYCEGKVNINYTHAKLKLSPENDCWMKGNRKLIRVKALQEVIKKAEEHFLPFIITKKIKLFIDKKLKKNKFHLN